MVKAHTTECVCAHCRDRKPFSAPEHLLEKIAAGEVIIFAGAGISTENRTFACSTFYDEVRAELAVTDNLSFPRLMDKLCELPDGRLKLLEKIKKRFEYFISFDGFYEPMSRFHRSLSPLFMITDVITTNWDDFFERECSFGAFVYDSDLAFWHAAKRRVMKIHGSITNFGSIVATTADYDASFERLNNGPLGAQLKSLLARKTVVYVGYSLSDENYLRLLSNIATMMGDSIRQSYIVAPNIDSTKISSAPVSLIPIETDGTYFLEEVRKELSERCGIVEDSAFHSCARALFKTGEMHSKTAKAFIKTQHPLLIFILSYQDGLIHGFRRILKLRNTGEYHSSDAVHRQIHVYDHIVDDCRDERNSWNGAYAKGYQAALIFLLMASEQESPAEPPFFWSPFNVSVTSLTAALRFPRGKLPRYVAKEAARILENYPKPAGLVPDHTPYL